MFLFIYFRWTLESLGTLELRKSALEEDFEEEEDKEENDQLDDGIEDGANEKVGLSLSPSMKHHEAPVILCVFSWSLVYY